MDAEPVCVDCGEPIVGETARFGGAILHPGCLARLNEELDAAFPFPEPVDDYSAIA